MTCCDFFFLREVVVFFHTMKENGDKNSTICLLCKNDLEDVHKTEY